MDHIAFLKDPDRWGAWPLCPVVRNGPEKWTKEGAGVVNEWEEGKVYFINLFAIKTGKLAEILKDVPFKEYGTWEAMVADGWVVD